MEFSQEDWNAVFQTEAGRKLRELLMKNGADVLAQAGHALKQGDTDAAIRAVAPLMQTEQAQQLIRQLQNRHG